MNTWRTYRCGSFAHKAPMIFAVPADSPTSIQGCSPDFNMLSCPWCDNNCEVVGELDLGRVIIRVEGGIAEVAAKPAGVPVLVLDYDEDSEDPVLLTHALAAEVVVEADAETLADLAQLQTPREEP